MYSDPAVGLNQSFGALQAQRHLRIDAQDSGAPIHIQTEHPGLKGWVSHLRSIVLIIPVFAGSEFGPFPSRNGCLMTRPLSVRVVLSSNL
ncbi:hypothetical protein ACO2Q8_11955 [Larkinella sp. VNQ87]|uniref:hypothetical protein n=1 Tax=Larkinella sp. VNQ87 TaxID=3400921 RepID=UPI003C050052